MDGRPPASVMNTALDNKVFALIGELTNHILESEDPIATLENVVAGLTALVAALNHPGCGGFITSGEME